MIRRLATAVLSVWLLLISAPAMAKTPPFSVEVEPASPIAGELATVTVELTQSIPVEDLTGLIAFFRAEDAESRVNGIEVALQRVGETTYEADVVLPEAGEWRVVSFPDRTGWSTDEVPKGYPDQIPIQVVGDNGTDATAIFVTFAVLLVAAVLVGRKASGPATHAYEHTTSDIN